MKLKWEKQQQILAILAMLFAKFRSDFQKSCQALNKIHGEYVSQQRTCTCVRHNTYLILAARALCVQENPLHPRGAELFIRWSDYLSPRKFPNTIRCFRFLLWLWAIYRLRRLLQQTPRMINKTLHYLALSATWLRIAGERTSCVRRRRESWFIYAARIKTPFTLTHDIHKECANFGTEMVKNRQLSIFCKNKISKVLKYLVIDGVNIFLLRVRRGIKLIMICTRKFLFM